MLKSFKHKQNMNATSYLMTRQTQVLISSYMKTGSKSIYRVMSLHTEGQHQRYDMKYNKYQVV